MGMLVDGVWHDVWYDTTETKGHFKRAASQFRNWITEDGALALPVPAVSRPKPTATTFMFRWRALGRTAR